MTRPRPTTTVPVKPVRDHLTHLLANGWTQQDIATRSGYSKQTIHNILYRNLRTHRDIEADLLSVGATVCAHSTCKAPAILHDVCGPHLLGTLDAGRRAAA